MVVVDCWRFPLLSLRMSLTVSEAMLWALRPKHELTPKFLAAMSELEG